METIYYYRGFQLQLSLDIDNVYIVGEVIPNEDFKDLYLYLLEH